MSSLTNDDIVVMKESDSNISIRGEVVVGVRAAQYEAGGVYQVEVEQQQQQQQEQEQQLLLIPAEELVPISRNLIPSALLNLFNLNHPPTTTAAAATSPSPSPSQSTQPYNGNTVLAVVTAHEQQLQQQGSVVSRCNSGIDPYENVHPIPLPASASASANYHDSPGSLKFEYDDRVHGNKSLDDAHLHLHLPLHHQHHQQQHGDAEMKQIKTGNHSESRHVNTMMGVSHHHHNHHPHQGYKRMHDGFDHYNLDDMGADMELSNMMNQMAEKESSSNSGDGMDGGSVQQGGSISSSGGTAAARTLKRPRLVWTPQLHKRFVDAVSHLGIRNAVPKTIMQLMNVGGLTRENVASHLQKYRLYLRRMQQGSQLLLFSPTSSAAAAAAAATAPNHTTTASPPNALIRSASASATSHLSSNSNYMSEQFAGGPVPPISSCDHVATASPIFPAAAAHPIGFTTSTQATTTSTSSCNINALIPPPPRVVQLQATPPTRNPTNPPSTLAEGGVQQQQQQQQQLLFRINSNNDDEAANNTTHPAASGRGAVTMGHINTGLSHHQPPFPFNTSSSSINSNGSSSITKPSPGSGRAVTVSSSSSSSLPSLPSLNWSFPSPKRNQSCGTPQMHLVHAYHNSSSSNNNYNDHYHQGPSPYNLESTSSTCTKRQQLNNMMMVPAAAAIISPASPPRLALALFPQ